MRHFLYLAALGGLLAARPACAQTDTLRTSRPAAAGYAPPTLEIRPAAHSAAGPVAEVDTAAAIHRLFAARRNRQLTVVGSTVLATLLGVGILLGQSSPGSGGGGSGYGSLVSGPLLDSQSIMAASVVLVAVPVVAAEAVLLRGWGRHKEQRAIEAWQQHRLPPRIRQQLKARYFQPATPVPGPQD